MFHSRQIFIENLLAVEVGFANELYDVGITGGGLGIENAQYVFFAWLCRRVVEESNAKGMNVVKQHTRGKLRNVKTC